ncbi:hypothetical protein Tco_0465331 [Tanacetum coccineum]
MTASSISSTNDVNTASPQNSNGSDLLHQDLKQIHEGKDLKWQLSLLSMRAKRYYQRTGKKIFINANDTAGYDKSKAMLAIDGVGFDWSDMAEEQVQINMALMAFSDSELNESKFKVATYKRGLATLEEQIITYKKNEVLFSEEIGVLKREVACKDYELGVLKTEFEKAKIDKFDKASKDLNQLLESQITHKSKKGLGFSAFPPSYPLIYNRPNKLDLSYPGLDEFKEPEFNGYGPRDTVLKSTIECEDKNSSVESLLNIVKETIFHAAKKVEFVKPKNEKPVRKLVRYAEMYRSQIPRGNQRN